MSLSLVAAGPVWASRKETVQRAEAKRFSDEIVVTGE